MTQEIRIENLRNHPKNIRRSYGNLKELAASIRENGVLQNLIVVPDPKNDGMYLVVAGNCRLRAAKKAGLETLPCNIVEMSEKEQVLTMLTENMQRNELSIAEEAAGIQMCLDDFGMKVPEVAKATGLSASTVRSRRNIAKLDLSAVKEKTMSSDFQLSITDLNSLSKVKDVDRRNEILAGATDSQNLKWKVEQAMMDEIKEKNLSILTKMLNEAGIELAENVFASDLYGKTWKIVKSFYLLDDTPDSLFDDEKTQPDDMEGLRYVIHYRELKIIKKNKRKIEKRELSEEDLKQKGIRKSRKEIKSLNKQMYSEMASFVFALMNGQLPKPVNESELLAPLWNIIVKKGIYVSLSSVIALLIRKESYQMGAEERDKAREKGETLPLYQQMMAVAVKGCNELETIDCDGHYSETNAGILIMLYRCLNTIGFTFSNEEYDQVMDGTHELYEPLERTVDSAGEGDLVTATSEEEHASDVEVEVSDEELPAEIGDGADEDGEAEESDSQEGFVVLEDGEHNPFEEEADMNEDDLYDEYPTVYSTEGRDSDDLVLSHEQAQQEEAA